MMRTSYINLRTLLGEYFHQDWSADDPDPLGIVARFVMEQPKHTVQTAASELDQLLEQSNEDKLRRILLSDMRSYYDPTATGKTVSAWLHEVARKLQSSEKRQG